MNLRGTSLSAVGLAAVLASVTAAASAQAPRTPRLSAIMVRQVGALARAPSNVSLLVAAGGTALQLGDADAAAGFFGRARELAPENASAHLGMASTLVALNRPEMAFAEFARARHLGLSSAAMAADLGLAYDLAGDQVKAQAVYRSGLNEADAAETRRRLALSLAIAGDAGAAAAVLQPLLAAGDRPAQLTRALILALSGDVAGSTTALNEIRRGSGSAAEPFLRALPALSAGEKAATLNLGIFPTRIGVPDAGWSSGEFASTDARSTAARPMEYGGSVNAPTPSTSDQLRKAKLALFGVFPDP
jgi:tetratricopeptide (TPR) repeat protein